VTTILAVLSSTDGTSGTIFGQTDDGTLVRIDVKDLGEPGRDDTYRIRTNTGYDSGEQKLARTARPGSRAVPCLRAARAPSLATFASRPPFDVRRRLPPTFPLAHIGLAGAARVAPERPSGAIGANGKCERLDITSAGETSTDETGAAPRCRSAVGTVAAAVEHLIVGHAGRT